MVSPTKTTGQAYSQVPNPQGSPTFNNSPNPNFTSPNPDLLSPEMQEMSLLGRRGSEMYPAPSLMSRDSTFNSLPGTPGNDNRASWASGAALAAAADGERAPRGQSNLAHSNLGWNNTDDERPSTEGAAAAPLPAIGEKTPRWANNGDAPKSRKGLWIGLGVLGLLLAAGLGVGLGVGLTRNKDTRNAGSNSGAAGDSVSNPSASSSGVRGPGAAPSSAPNRPTSGGQGSTIYLEDGTTMIYDNPHGGKWVDDPNDPFSNEAQCNSWTPALNKNWTWGIDKVHGVNLGGWFNTEPFIVPGLYEKYANGTAGTAVDEYTLVQNMGSNLTAAMTEHYETFITERDFAEIASAGLSWIRLPIGHWAVQKTPEEPYLERVSWQYILKALKWARKYGIRVNFDLHTMPGSQNGWNHSGKIGQINWMGGTMGLANAQRALEIIRTLTEFIVQPEYAPLIPLWGFVNEPNANALSKSAVGSFYREAYNMIRGITGIGEGHGPMLSVHDGFIGIRQWYDFMPGADRISLDQHPYMVFGDQPQGSMAAISKMPCSWWAKTTNDTSNQFGVNVAGEWSGAMNDCGQWINAVGAGSRYDGTYAGYTGPSPGSCDQWNDYRLWDQATKDNLKHFIMSSADSFQNYFFWTWKIGNSTGPIPEVNPFWHYRLGLREGWIPNDPRQAVGYCAMDGVSGDDFSGTYASAYMTGGPGAGTIPAAQTSSYPWPPRSFTNVPAASMTLLPQYTSTGTPITMPGPTYTKPGSTQTVSAGSGWAQAADNRQAYVAVSGCVYPPEYSASNLPITAGMCGAGALVSPTRATKVAKRTAAPAPRR